MGFSAKAAHKPPLPQACGPHLSPFLTSVCSSMPVIMPGMHELRLPERFFQNLGEDEDLMEAQFVWSEEEEEAREAH